MTTKTRMVSMLVAVTCLLTTVGYLNVRADSTASAYSIAMPVASGSNVKKNEKSLIDISNTGDGYIMVKYLEKTTKALKVQVKGPGGTTYTYTLRSDGEYETYPLTDGNGSYQITVLENVDGTKYAVVNSAAADVKLLSEFAPFLLPNQYVNYKTDSKMVKKAAELVSGCSSTTEKIAAIYSYVINNVTYDKDLAAEISSGALTNYLPDVDSVLASGKGICFDYAALMTAMLRSQGIPAKLIVGYTGDLYHAWINAYSDESGWIDSVIQFDGKTWKLMDPTFVSSASQSSEVMKYVGDGNNYKSKFSY